MDRWRIKSFVALALSACWRDPILDRAEQLGASTADAPEAGALPATFEHGGGGPSKVGAATPGSPPPAAPPPGSPGPPAPGGGHRFDGPTVTLTGAVEAEGWTGGAIRVEIFDGDQRDPTGPRPEVVAVAAVASPGPFQLVVPRQVGQVWVGATADENGSGRPDEGDLVGWYDGNPVAVDADRTGLAIRLGPMAGGGHP